MGLFDYQSRNQDLVYRQQIRRNGWPDFDFKVTRSDDFIDKFLVQLRKVSEIKNLVNHSGPAYMQYGLKWPISNAVFSGLNTLGIFFGRSFHLTEDPLMDDVVAYRGYVCKGCFMPCIIPTYGFKETGKIVDAQHDCDRRFTTHTVPNSMTNMSNVSNDIDRLNQVLLNELKSIVNKWTNNEAHLTAIPCSGLREIIDLPRLNDESHGWVKRTVLEGKSILSDLELLDFLKSSGNKTFGFFRLNRDLRGCPYFMWINRTGST